jgi:hypothetical protein
MIKRFFSAAMMVAIVAIGAPVRAENPMTPSHPTAPPSATQSPSSSTAQPWVEPPAEATPKTPSPSTAETAAPTAQSVQPLRQMHNARVGRRYHANRARGRSWSTDHLARQLNRQELYGGWSGASMPYWRGYGPPAYSPSGP